MLEYSQEKLDLYDILFYDKFCKYLTIRNCSRALRHEFKMASEENAYFLFFFLSFYTADTLVSI